MPDNLDPVVRSRAALYFGHRALPRTPALGLKAAAEQPLKRTRRKVGAQNHKDHEEKRKVLEPAFLKPFLYPVRLRHLRFLLAVAY